MATCRVETKNSSSSSWRRTRFYRIHKSARGTTWARTRTTGWGGWAVSTCRTSLLSSMDRGSAAVGKGSRRSVAGGSEEEAVSAEAPLTVEGTAAVRPSGAVVASPSDLGECHQPLFTSTDRTDDVVVIVSAINLPSRFHVCVLASRCRWMMLCIPCSSYVYPLATLQRMPSTCARPSGPVVMLHCKLTTCFKSSHSSSR